MNYEKLTAQEELAAEAWNRRSSGKPELLFFYSSAVLAAALTNP